MHTSTRVAGVAGMTRRVVCGVGVCDRDVQRLAKQVVPGRSQSSYVHAENNIPGKKCPVPGLEAPFMVVAGKFR